MISRLLAAILIAFSFTSSFAQNNDYFSLKEVRNMRFDHLAIAGDKEVNTFLSRMPDFNFIEALKVGQTTQMDALLARVKTLYSLKELNLKDYTGDFNEHSFDSCGDIEILHIQVREDKLDQLKYLPHHGSLQALYIYISGRPETLEPLKDLPQLNEIHLIGDFLPKDLQAIIDNLKGQRLLRVLGLSVDRITDLPKSIAKNRMMSKLVLYDNLSVFTNKGIEDLSEQKLSIVFNMAPDLVSAVAISYYSNNGELSDFERDYLQQVFAGDVFAQQFEQEEVVSENTTNIPFRKEFTPDFPTTSEFHPPYPAVQPVPEIFVIQPGDNSVLYSGTGMKITIPSGSFVNAAGEIVKDPVYIKVTQFMQTQDILFAGLDLNSGGTQFCNQFLFNIQATTEKSSVTLREGYQMKVMMPAAADSSKKYFFDYESNTWQDQNLYNDVFANNFVPLDFYRIESPGQHTAYYLLDTSSFNERFNSQHNYLLNDRNNDDQILYRKKKYFTDLNRPWNKDYNKGIDMTGTHIHSGKAYIKIQKVIPTPRNRERQYFSLLNKSDKSLFPELKPFISGHILFNVKVNPGNKREFSETYIKDVKYFDVRIQYTEGKEYCDIILKTSEGYRKLQAYITDTDNRKLMAKQINRFRKAYAQYLKIKARREAEFNTLNSQRLSEYKLFSDERIRALEKSAQYTEIKVAQLGTFGMMYMKEPVFSTNIIAQYTDENGLPIDVRELFMVDSRYNTVIRIKAGNFVFDPATCLYIVATDYSGNLYYAGKNDIPAASLSNNSLTYIKLKKASTHMNSIAFFNKLLKN